MIKVLPTENLRPLKWTPRKRDLFSDAQVQSICDAAFRPVFDEGRVVPAGESGKPLKNSQQFADFVQLMAGCGSDRKSTRLNSSHG